MQRQMKMKPRFFSLLTTMIILGLGAIYVPELLGSFLSNYGYIRLVSQMIRITEELPGTGGVVVNQLADCSGSQPTGQSRIYFEAARMLSPDSVSANRGAGIALLVDGNCSAAIIEFQNVLRLAPRDQMAWFWLGKAYYDDGQNLQAINAWKRLNGSGMKDYFINLSWGEFLQGQSMEGIKWLEWAVDLDPQDSEARYHIGLIWLGQESFREARSALEDALAYNPNHAGVASALAQTYWREGDVSMAYVWAIRANELQSRDVETYIILCDYSMTRDVDEASRWCNMAVSRFPDSVWPWIYRGQFYYTMNFDEEALNDVRHAQILAPYNIEARLLGGRILTRMAHWSEAVDEYQTIIGIDPTHVAANCELAAIYWTVSLADQAYVAYQTCVSLDPSNATAQQRLEALQDGKDK